MFEIFPITSTVRSSIAAQVGREQVERELKSEDSSFVTLRENAIKLVLEGVTSAAEVLRVVNEDE